MQLSLHDHCQELGEVSPRTFYFLPRLADYWHVSKPFPVHWIFSNQRNWLHYVASTFYSQNSWSLSFLVTKFLELFFLAGHFCTFITELQNQKPGQFMCFNRQSLRCEVKFMVPISDVQNCWGLGQQLFGDNIVGKWGTKQEKRLRKEPVNKIIVSKSTQLQYVWRVTQIQNSMELTHLPQISLYLLLVYIISYYCFFFWERIYPF